MLQKEIARQQRARAKTDKPNAMNALSLLLSEATRNNQVFVDLEAHREKRKRQTDGESREHDHGLSSVEALA